MLGKLCSPSRIALAVLVLSQIGSAGTAAAASLEIEPGNEIATASEGRLTFRSGMTYVVECRWTLRGRFQTGVIAKAVGTKFGQIDTPSVSNCVAPGSITAFLTTPWDITYEGILGTLPFSVTGLEYTLNRVGIALEVSGIACLYSGSITMLRALIPQEGVRGLYRSGRASIVGDNLLKASGTFCAAAGDLTGFLEPVSPAQNILRL